MPITLGNGNAVSWGWRLAAAFTAGLVQAALCAPAWAASQACDSLPGLHIAPSTLGGGAVSVTSAKHVAADGNVTAKAYCLVVGTIAPIDPKAYDINFNVALPDDWNGKAVMYGGQGFDGFIPNVTAAPVLNFSGTAPVARGYAVFASDSGHQSSGPLNVQTFFGNKEAYLDYVGNAVKKTRDAAMAIIAARYGRAPRRSYFIGGSKGGGEALQAVSRWPHDWDGAVALYPVGSVTVTWLGLVAEQRTMVPAGAHLSAAQQDLLHRAALQACDLRDGVEDGIISNTRGCDAAFNPSTAKVDGHPLQCPKGEAPTNACLTPVQIDALRRIESPTVLHLGDPSGPVLFPGFRVLGSDLRGLPHTPVAVPLLGNVPPSFPSNPDMSLVALLADPWVRFAVARDANFNTWKLNPADLGPFAARVAELRKMDMVSNNLNAFSARRGKLIVVQGTEDMFISPRTTEQYISQVRRNMGQQRFNATVRYFEIPGFGHALNRTFVAAFDHLDAIDAWVERGIDPSGHLVMTDQLGLPGRTRPACQYPAWPSYVGGDVNSAKSYRCVAH